MLGCFQSKNEPAENFTDSNGFCDEFNRKCVGFLQNSLLDLNFKNSVLISVSMTVTVDMAYNVIQRNENDYLQVESLKIKFLNENFSTDLHSKSLSLLTNGFINRAMNADWRCLMKEIELELEIAGANLFRSIVELIVDKIAIHHFFDSEN